MHDSPSNDEEYNLSQIKQRPSRLNAKRIGSVMRQLMSQSGYGQTQLNAQLDAAWAEAAGESLCKLTRVGNISRGVLQVNAANSSVLQEISFSRKRIVARLQQALPELKIRDLKARVGPII